MGSIRTRQSQTSTATCRPDDLFIGSPATRYRRQAPHKAASASSVTSPADAEPVAPRFAVGRRDKGEPAGMRQVRHLLTTDHAWRVVANLPNTRTSTALTDFKAFFSWLASTRRSLA